MFWELNSVYNSDVWRLQKVKIQMINATSQIGNPSSKLVRQGTHLSTQTSSHELLFLRGEDFMVSTIIISQKTP